MPVFVPVFIISERFIRNLLSADCNAAGKIHACHGGSLREIVWISGVFIEIISHFGLCAAVQKTDGHSLRDFHRFIHFTGNDQSVYITVTDRLKISVGYSDSLLLLSG